MILIVEDQEAMAEQLRDFVQAAHPGVAVALAASGAAAFAACEARAPDLILMDIRLPDADGIALTAQIRARWPAVAIIVVSQHRASVYVERAHAAGAFAYLSKDRIAEGLLPLVAKALRPA